MWINIIIWIIYNIYFLYRYIFVFKKKCNASQLLKWRSGDWSALYSTSVLFCSADSELEDAVVEVIDHHLLQRPTSPLSHHCGAHGLLCHLGDWAHCPKITRCARPTSGSAFIRWVSWRCDKHGEECERSQHDWLNLLDIRWAQHGLQAFSRRRYLIEMWDVSRKITSC